MKYLLNGTKSKRLDYRIVTQEDFDEWLPFFYNEEAIKLYIMPEVDTKEELCQAWMDRIFKRYEENKGGFNALIDPKTGKMVGQCGLLIQEVDGDEVMEIGYALLPEFWGNGYAIEAAIHCKEEAFKRGWADSLVSIIHPENHASKMVAKRNGMELDKETVWNGMKVGVWKVERGSGMGNW